MTEVTWRDTCIERFGNRFGHRPDAIVRAPGRVNLIGEHTDYNDGLVLPIAIEPSVYVAAGHSPPDHDDGGRITVHSAALDETAAFPIDVCDRATEEVWQNYIRGVMVGLRRAGVTVSGTDLLITGDLPVGGGLSSSAALCVGVAKAILALSAAELDTLTLAQIVQRAEHEFAGTPCGIMDPYVVLHARKDHALLIDCRAVTHECVPINLGDAELVLIDSGVKHDLAAGAYAARVRECQAAVTSIREHLPVIESLRDINQPMLPMIERRLDPVLFRRLRHVVTENTRVRAARGALMQAQPNELGRLLNESHASLRDDYEVSCDEVERLINALRASPSVYGARMIGGGFGGWVLAVCDREFAMELAWNPQSRWTGAVIQLKTVNATNVI